MPIDSGNNTTNNDKNKFPNQGNFSASQNNVGTNIRQVGNNIPNNNANSNGGGLTDNPQGIVNNVKKEVTKKGLEVAADTYVPGSGQLVKAAANTKLGNKALNAATNLSTNPLQAIPILGGLFQKNNSKNKQIEEENTESISEDGEPIEAEASGVKGPSKIVGISTAITSLGCFGGIILVVIIAAVMLSPIFFISGIINGVKNGLEAFWDNIVYFFKGCKNEEECEEKEEKSFYETLEEVHNEYKGEPYYITLNTELITATLTYFDPMDVMDETPESDSDMPFSNSIDFKKSEKKIEELAEAMVAKGVKCVDNNGNVVAEYKENEKSKDCPSQTGTDENGQSYTYTPSKEDWYYVDEDKYRTYLEDTFVRKFFFDDKKNEEVDKQIPIVVEDIFSRVELVKYLNSGDNTGDNSVLNNTQVLIEECNSDVVIAQVDLFEYIQGVMYIEAGLSNPTEYKKAMAVAIKNYLFAKNGATVDNIPNTFRIKSCTDNQVYCSVTEGCHKNSNGTMVPGPDLDGNYYGSFGPITNVETMESLNSIINETFSTFIIDSNNKFLLTQYKTNCTDYTCADENDMDQEEAIKMASEGMDYISILEHFYNGTIEQIDIKGSGLPLDVGSYYVSSEFGRRDCSNKKISCYHHGIDLAVTEKHNVYSIMDGTVVRAELTGTTSSWGWYVKIGHDLNGDNNYDIYSAYAHLYPGSVLVSVGDTVNAGQKIALSGGKTYPSGSSTGAHLHFEIYEGCADISCRVNPRGYINF